MALTVAATALLAPQWAHAQQVVLNPQDISNFTLFGGQAPVSGGVVNFSDASGSDVSFLVASAPFAAPGTTVDLIATFQVTPHVGPGVDAGFSLFISDGPAGNTIAMVRTLLVDGIPGIGLSINFADPSSLGSYVYVPAEWQASQLTVHLRRWADGSAEIVELNGAPPSQPVVLLSPFLPPIPFSFGGPSVGFGLMSALATADAEVTEFRAFTVSAIPEPEIYAMFGVGLGLIGWVGRRKKL